MLREGHYAPRAPFSPRPDLFDPRREIAAWFTDPPGVIVQFVRPSHCTRAHAEWLLGFGHRALQERFPGVTRFVSVLDLRLMTSRDVAARSLMLERSVRRRHRFLQSYVLPPESAGPIYVTSVQAAVTLLRVMGVQIDLACSLDEVIRAASLRPAARKLRLTGGVH